MFARLLKFFYDSDDHEAWITALKPVIHEGNLRCTIGFITYMTGMPFLGCFECMGFSLNKREGKYFLYDRRDE